MLARIAMIAITTSNSMRVNAEENNFVLFIFIRGFCGVCAEAMSGRKIRNATSEFALMLKIPNPKKPNPKQIPSPKSQMGRNM